VSHTAQPVVPVFAALIAAGVWLACFAAIERLQLRATGGSRPFPVNELLTAGHAAWVVILTASAALVYVLVAKALILLSIAGAYGFVWAASDREKISKRFRSWPAGATARLRIASVAASIAARVAYLVTIALLAIAIVNTVSG
jgi:hypothetical protein